MNIIFGLYSQEEEHINLNTKCNHFQKGRAKKHTKETELNRLAHLEIDAMRLNFKMSKSIDFHILIILI